MDLQAGYFYTPLVLFWCHENEKTTSAAKWKLQWTTHVIFYFLDQAPLGLDSFAFYFLLFYLFIYLFIYEYSKINLSWNQIVKIIFFHK
jgi:hypothetical protein